MLYASHEFHRAILAPVTAWAKAAADSFVNPASPLAYVSGASRVSAAFELTHRLGKKYERLEFNIHNIDKYGHSVPIIEQQVLEKPFCRLLRFKRYADNVLAVEQMKREPVVLLCAPLSGHHSTLLRESVRTLLQDHKVYVTDWIDARMVPGDAGSFDLDDSSNICRNSSATSVPKTCT